MEMKWIHSKGKGDKRVWLEDMINVKAVTWNEVEEGDLVFIAGNIKDGFPTALYGRHIVVDPKKNILMDARMTNFYERWPFIYKEIVK